MITLLPTDTLADVSRKIAEEAAAARREAIANAKTTMAYLMAAGVIVSCDDDYERAMIHAGREERAKAAGRTFRELEELEEAHRAMHNARAYCGRVLLAGEAPHEARVRREAILALAVGTMDNGKRCKHRETRQHRGWMHVPENHKDITWTDEAGAERITKAHPDGMMCCRCGAFASDAELARDGEPTDEAKAAAAILEAAGPALFRVTIYRQGVTEERTVSALTSDHAVLASVDASDSNMWAVAYAAAFDATP